jgi:thioredoxin 1
VRVVLVNYIEVNSANWNEEISKSEILTLVYFWHDACTWCLRLNPIFNEITEEYKGRMKFAKLNVLANEPNREIASNYGVMSTPTFVFFCHSKPVGLTVGFMQKDQLEKVLEDMLQRYAKCLVQSTDLRPFYIV